MMLTGSEVLKTGWPEDVFPVSMKSPCGQFSQCSPLPQFKAKAGANPSQVLHSRVGSWVHPQTLDLARKFCQGQTL